jgi:hypothetical protein
MMKLFQNLEKGEIETGIKYNTNDNILLKTIMIPKNLLFLTDKLP